MTSDERVLTAAQIEHLRRLYTAFEQAQERLNDFVDYLLSEHGIAEREAWQLSRDMTRFVKVGGEDGGGAGD